jgi:hypothetical protein
MSCQRPKRHQGVLVCGGALAIAFASATMTASCYGQPLQKEDHLALTTRASEEIIVYGEANADQFCRALNLPSLFLDKPPDHGIVCFEVGEFEVGDAILGDDACRGRMVRGVNIFYRSRAGFTGSDSLRYFTTDVPMRHIVSVDLSVAAQTLTVDPADGTWLPQSSGPMPSCTRPVS